MSKIKTTIGRKTLKGDLLKALRPQGSEAEELVFYDSQGRQILAGDQITTTSKSGFFNESIAGEIFKHERSGQLCISVKDPESPTKGAFIEQDSIYAWPDRVISKTAQAQGRMVNPDIFNAVPKNETSGIKTTLE